MKSLMNEKHSKDMNGHKTTDTCMPQSQISTDKHNWKYKMEYKHYEN